MQRESPTDATVITHPSIITKVTVVPDVFAVQLKIIYACQQTPQEENKDENFIIQRYKNYQSWLSWYVKLKLQKMQISTFFYMRN